MFSEKEFSTDGHDGSSLVMIMFDVTVAVMNAVWLLIFCVSTSKCKLGNVGVFVVGLVTFSSDEAMGGTDSILRNIARSDISQVNVRHPRLNV